MKNIIEKVIESGNSASQGLWEYLGHYPDGDLMQEVVCKSLEKDENGRYNYVVIGDWESEKDARFCCDVANARPAIKAMQAENERLRGALEAIAGQENNQSVVRIKQIAEQALKDSALAREVK